MSTTAAPVRSNRFPSGIPYIVGNEACERFSFYGMRAILWIYLAQALFAPMMEQAAADAKATQVMHFFIAGVYAFPMIGALVADRLLGKYQTIIWLSLVYCAGHGVLALWGQTVAGVYLGLALIAVGSGGIKPCVSANVGDQFGRENAHLLEKIYQIFYFSINFGSFFSTLITPWLYKAYGPEIAFGIPGILMFIATVIFWMGRNRFVKVPAKPGGKLGMLDALSSIALFMVPGAFFLKEFGGMGTVIAVSVTSLIIWAISFSVRQRIEPDSGFMSVLVYSLRNQGKRKPGMGFFEVARERFGEEAAEGPAAVLKIAVVFAPIPLFWALFDQHASTWVKQATMMDLVVNLPLYGTLELQAAQISALNPVMVMLIIPLLNVALYPPLRRWGVNVTPLRKMVVGMFIAAFAFVAAALLQVRIDALAATGAKVPVLWQFVQYLIMTTSEVLVSVTGLEFAYTQAPRAMKSTIMGFWLMTVTLGNLLVAFLAGFENLTLAAFFWTFAGLMSAAAVLFAIIAYFYKGKTYLQDVKAEVTSEAPSPVGARSAATPAA
jgi:POT family proton-dependent oligopeptide transporter